MRAAVRKYSLTSTSFVTGARSKGGVTQTVGESVVLEFNNLTALLSRHLDLGHFERLTILVSSLSERGDIYKHNLIKQD